VGDTADGSWHAGDLDAFILRRRARWIDSLVGGGASHEAAISALMIVEREARGRGENPDVACERFVADFLEARSCGRSP
jgi:hypothetical protein